MIRLKISHSSFMASLIVVRNMLYVDNLLASFYNSTILKAASEDLEKIYDLISMPFKYVRHTKIDNPARYEKQLSESGEQKLVDSFLGLLHCAESDTI